MSKISAASLGIVLGLGAVGVGACGPSTVDGKQDPAADAGQVTEPDAQPQNLSDAAPVAERAEVFAHSDTTLFRLDPNTLEVTTIADFSGCTGVIDIALDKDSNLYGTTFSGLYAIDIETAACTEIATGSYPNSLSFVPVGTLSDQEEVLVAYLGSQYIQIDVTTGAINSIGNIEGGYTSSGDVVSVQGGGTFLTADGPDCNDCLLEINPTDGTLIKNWGELGFSDVWGLAYWGGIAYGFDDNGTAFSIEFGVDSVTTTPIAFPGSPAGLRFWGAGSTTAAPTID